MCGIFGAIAADGSLTHNQAAFIKAATLTGQLRGEDGTGWILQPPKGDPRTFKRALCGNDFLDTRIGRKATTALNNAQVCIGHNRKTTSGGDRDRDCHPYMYDNLVGVHNGGIPITVLDRLETKDTVADVDSAKLYAGLNAVDDPIKVLEKVHLGAYALVWIDKRTNEVCMARNGDRPMWVSSSKNGMYFASEPGMLFWLMSRFGLQNEDSKLLELQEEHLYRIPLDNPANVKRTKYKATAPVYKHKPYVPPAKRNNSATWYDKNNAPKHYRYVNNVKSLESTFPTLSYLSPVITDNLEAIDAAYPSQSDNPTRIDVIVTDVQPRDNNALYPNVYGYMLDTTDSGLVIPVAMVSVKDDGYDFVKRFEDAKKEGMLFSLRGSLNSIKVVADGNIVLSVRVITVWDVKYNVPKNSDRTLAGMEVRDVLRPPTTQLDSNTLLEMWKQLECKTIDGKVVN